MPCTLLSLEQGLIEVRAGWATTKCTLKIDVTTTRIVRCRVPQEKKTLFKSKKLYQMQSPPSLSIPQFQLRELCVCFGRQNRILAEIGHGDSSVQIGLWPNPVYLLSILSYTRQCLHAAYIEGIQFKG